MTPPLSLPKPAPRTNGSGGGSTGAPGPQGPKGDTGATGAAGATGAQGVKGDPGTPGATGAQGPQGVKGDTGATGAQGTAGTPGATGAQGPKGDTGAASTVPGPVGPSGIPVGVTWDDFTSGVAPGGGTGTNGSTILTGTGAPTGTTGATGYFYVDTVTDVLYGPKGSDNSWPIAIDPRPVAAVTETLAMSLIAPFTGLCTGYRSGKVVTLLLNVSTPSATGGGAGAATIAAGWRPPAPGGASAYFTVTDSGSGSPTLAYIASNGVLACTFGRGAGTGTIGTLTYVTP